MNKLEALNYLADNGNYGSEWQEAGMCHILVPVLRSTEIVFTKEYLDELIIKAYNN